MDIELVIKIPEDEYRWIVKSNETVFANIASKECMLHAIKNATPLPKHGRLIDADALIESLDCSDRDIYCKGVIEEDAPTIIEANKESEDCN